MTRASNGRARRKWDAKMKARVAQQRAAIIGSKQVLDFKVEGATRRFDEGVCISLGEGLQARVLRDLGEGTGYECVIERRATL